MAESPDISRLSTIFVSSLKMRHEKNKKVEIKLQSGGFLEFEPSCTTNTLLDKSESEFFNLWDVPSG